MTRIGAIRTTCLGWTRRPRWRIVLLAEAVFASSWSGLALNITGTRRIWSAAQSVKTWPKVSHSLYGKSKRQASDRLSEIFRSSGLEFANGRVFYPIGPGEHPNRFLPMVIRSLLAGRKPQLGPATQIRDVIDVRDVGRALGMLVGSRLVGVVNIASGISTRLSDVAIQIGNRMSRADLIRFGREVPPAGDPPRLVADVTKLTAQLGFKPQYAIADTLDAAIAFWKARDGDVQSTGSQYA
jgi:nucleoside-diphosphate-sugar epimerase